jgi:hypothetical protein
MENENNLGLVRKKTIVEKLIYKLQEDEYIQFPLPIKLYYDFKQMEIDHEYETKAYWFGRGILAATEDRIDELKPIKDGK